MPRPVTFSHLLPFVSFVVTVLMARLEQYEIWVLDEGKWQMIASFREFDIASAMARNRSSRMRLIRSVYENGQPVEQQVLAELGATREEP